MKYFKKDIKLIIIPWLIVLPLCISLTADIIIFTILKITSQETFFLPGAVIGIFLSVFFIPIYTLIYSNVYLDLAISMGRKRKGFLLNLIIGILLFTIFPIVILILISNIYPVINTLFFNGLPLEGDFSGCIDFNTAFSGSPIILGILAASICIGIIYSAVIRKYGAQVAAFIWMLFCFSPMIMNKILHLNLNLSPAIIITLASIFIGIIITVVIISYMYIAKADIKI